MTVAATAVNKSGFVMLTNDLLNIEKIGGKSFTGNMKIVYSLIQGFERNGQSAYFSQDRLAGQLGLTDRSVRNLLRDMVEMGLINKTGQIGGKTCHYTVNQITPEMVGTPEAVKPAKPELTKTEAVHPEVQPVETVENAGANQPGVIECGSEIVHSSHSEQNRNDELDDCRATVRDLSPVGAVIPATPVIPVEPQPVEVKQIPRGQIKEPSRYWDLDPAF
ncbi:helix-turn-helix domain-containing protein [Cronobacter turicensis]|uniref:helix-turn-helix domain-containing protein n=1 Tax=Cronobacter turicensis TaxID=413502 RepID=UPI0024AEA1BD|nr:helix-turn-helix domain-containing protein [Cronobacter turicensis]MDI7419080.1 hypothetical protein [Cronobacter turicensis]MDI7497970.1 hypothetical protein [Cronobacter turicensis]